MFRDSPINYETAALSQTSAGHQHLFFFELPFRSLSFVCRTFADILLFYFFIFVVLVN